MANVLNTDKQIAIIAALTEGIVEVFHLHGHPDTQTAYAWSHDTDDPSSPKRHVTVLHIHPALSPLDAVRAALIQEFRNAQTA
jgi:hypothetical protein